MITVHELSASWEEIEARDGKPGSDGVTVSDFRKRAKSSLKSLAKEIATGAYRTAPARKIRVPKSNDTWRSISILCVRDRIVHHALCQAIRPVLEPGMSDVSHAFRVGRGVNSAVACVRNAVSSGYEWAVNGDIADYFDSIDTWRLLALTDAWLPGDLAQLTRACIEPLATNGRGIPQGSAISPILSNLYLDTFDAEVSEIAPTVRYADNFICLARTKKEAEGLMHKAGAFLADFALKLNPRTAIMPASGMAFLGETI